MKEQKINPLIRWWVTPKLPAHDIYVEYAKNAKNPLEKVKIIASQWVAHPIKRRLARVYLKLLQKVTDIKVIAITGSAGKTTTKEMVASILSLKGKTVWTPKSVDSVYNIPNTILKTRPGVKYLVLEMSVEFPGEMDFYLWLAKPDVGIITNIFPTHTLYLKDVKGVAREKGKMITSLGKQDIAVLNSANFFTRNIGKKTKARIIWFGDKGDISANNQFITRDINIEYTLRVIKSNINIQLESIGEQLVENSLAAAATAYSLGIGLKDIKIGLETYRMPEHRMSLLKHQSGALIIDDSYNNNPQAAREALKTLQKIAGNRKKIVVMGDMLELGGLEKKSHNEVGQLIGEMEVDYLIGVGKASKLLVSKAKSYLGKDKCAWAFSYIEVLPFLRPYLKSNTVVLIKGSRSISLDKVVSRLF